MKAAAGNEWSRDEVMLLLLLLLEQRGAEVVVTEEVVKAAAGNYRSGKEATSRDAPESSGQVKQFIEGTLKQVKNNRQPVLRVI